MPDIILVTLNARYSHASLGLRYLRANLGNLRPRSAIREFVIQDDPQIIAESILAEQPQVVTFGVYIWNLRQTEQVAQIIRAVAPEVSLIAGGPELSHGTDHTSFATLADVIVQGEGDSVIAPLCQRLLDGEPGPQVVDGGKPNLEHICLPYDEYTDEDIRQRIIYVEASRGCPFTCEFCLSSIDNGVRAFNLDAFLDAMGRLIDRGCRTFKFVDRTFNLKPSTCERILNFFLDRWPRTEDGSLVSPLSERQMDQGGKRNQALFLHFEMVPDRLPDNIKHLIQAFPAGAIQFEIGIQSFTPSVGVNIRRRMDIGRTEANLAWLRAHASVHVHADLIIGLPGETPESFAASFDRLYDLQPGEIQVGILKNLRGTSLIRHQQAYGLEFATEPPYDLLASDAFPFPVMQRFKRFARYYEIFVNSGRFSRAIALLITSSQRPSPCAALLNFSDQLWETTHQVHAFAKPRQYQLLLDYLLHNGVDHDTASTALAADFLDSGTQRGLPESLRPAVDRLHKKAQRQHTVGSTAHMRQSIGST